MSVIAYAQIQATTRALYSQMLSPGVWTTLIQAPDLDAVLGELSKTVYGAYLQLDRRLLTPRRIVYQGKRYLADRYTKLMRLAPEAAANLIRLLWRSYEVDNLKAILRGIETGATWEQILFLLSPIPAHAALALADLEMMVQSGAVIRAIERLKNTDYYDTLSHALERYQREQNLFPLEVALDLAYYRELWQCIQALPPRDRDYALRTVGVSLMADNLLWALRYRIYHKLSGEEIINYTLALNPRITDADIRAIAGGEQPGEVIARIFPEVASQVPGDLVAGTQGLRQLELILQRYVVKLCRGVFVGDPFQIGIPLAYLQLMEHEIRDLTTLIEAKASQLPPSVFTAQLELYVPFERQDSVGASRTLE
ncbi:MAG TPA: V-type ATPase subunit [Anaerolineae bacterium]|nr:V-type ATPase subunit [Anaerolineae bacterium]